MSNVFQSTKVIELGSCAFRQWRATHSHCSKLHGYQLKAKFWFSCSELDDKNWSVDFGGLKELKKLLNYQFDHTTCVAVDDPALPMFEKLAHNNVIELRVMDSVGAERTAQWVYVAASKFIAEHYGDRCWIDKVEVFEHENNSAIYTRPEKTFTGVGMGVFVPLTETVEPVAETSVESTPEPVYNNDRAAPVGRKSTPGIGDLYAGTIWG